MSVQLLQAKQEGRKGTKSQKNLTTWARKKQPSLFVSKGILQSKAAAKVAGQALK